MPVMGAAFAIAMGTSSVRSAGRADKASIAAPKALVPRAYGSHRMARPGMQSVYHYKRLSKHSLSQKEGDLVRGTNKLGSKGGIRTWK